MALREITYNPALQNDPSIYTQQSPYSPYRDRYNSATTPVYMTPLLAPDIDPTLHIQWPKQFTDMAFWMSLPKVGVKNLEYNWGEIPWIHNPIYVRAPGIAATAAVANAVVTQVVPITDASIPYIRKGDKVKYLTTTVEAQGIVTAIVTTLGAGTITVSSMEGKGLPALTTADYLNNHGPWTGDGISTIYSTTQMEVIMYNNWLEEAGAYARRWDPQQLHIWKMNGTTDYVEQDRKTTLMRLYTTMQARLLTSTLDRTLIDSNYVTSTSGLLEQMSNAGVLTQTVTAAQAVDAMRQVIFDTALNDGGTRVILATRENLNRIGTAHKADLVRYNATADTTYDNDIYQYRWHGYSTIEVPMDQWRDVGLYGPNMQNTILILNKEDLEVNFLQGWPMVSAEYELINEQNSNPTTGLNTVVRYYKALFGLKVKRAFATGRLLVQ